MSNAAASSSTAAGRKEVSPNTLFIRTLFTVQIFGAIIAGANYFLHVQAHSDGNNTIKSAFQAVCAAPSSPSPTSLYRAYTDIPALDYIACLLNTFFTTLLTPPNRVTFASLLLSLPIAYFPILLDASILFKHRPLLAIAVPLVFGCIGQLKGAGLYFPLYWLFSLMAQVQPRAEGRKAIRTAYDRPFVLATCIAAILGGLIPTVVMILWTQELTPGAVPSELALGVMTLWQFFPVYCAVIQLGIWLNLEMLTPPPPPVKEGEAKAEASTSAAAEPEPELGQDPVSHYVILGTFAVLALTVTVLGHLPFVLEMLYPSKSTVAAATESASEAAESTGSLIKSYFQKQVAQVPLLAQFAPPAAAPSSVPAVPQTFIEKWRPTRSLDAALEFLGASLVPPYDPHASRTPTSASIPLSIAQHEIVRFIQWDGIFLGLGTWLAGVWSWPWGTARFDVPAVLAATILLSVGVFTVLGPAAFLAVPFVAGELLRA
ncbi:hypothetical protein DL93DRAFT_2084673 [Clavulina sp. PMI_390]|nr:hypothetical protein DL93DRAFT_2084673 [Clavulina sp. PMI_390]